MTLRTAKGVKEVRLREGGRDGEAFWFLMRDRQGFDVSPPLFDAFKTRQPVLDEELANALHDSKGL